MIKNQVRWNARIAVKGYTLAISKEFITYFSLAESSGTTDETFVTKVEE